MAGQRRPPTGPLLFASGLHDPRARRPTDVAMAAFSVVALIVTSVVAGIGADLDAGWTDLLAQFPPFLDPLWELLAWAPIAWALVVLVAAIVRRRPTLARDIAAGVVVAVFLAVLLGRWVTDDPWDVVARLADLDGPPVYPPGAITVAAAAIAVASPHLSRPFRDFGRWLLLGQVVAVLFLGAARATGASAAIFLGLLAAAVVHLVVGSPGGRPTASRIELALDELGVDASDLTQATMQSGGVVRFVGSDAAGPIDVKVYGRDAWDAQLMANLWRLAWYRGARRTARLSRIELVEHEGFMTLLAERAGVRIPVLVTAGSAGKGDALVVVRQDGHPASVQVDDVTDDALDGWWRDLDRLHDAG
ncbi:MAG: hypothetical protein ABW122_03070, partial [Ilumatobacteraceae bacterium]